MSARILLGLFVVFFCFSVARVWLLYILAESVDDLPTIPVAGADHSESAAADEDITARNHSEAYLAAAQALRDGDHALAMRELERCGPLDVACVGLRGEMHLIGAGTPRNLTEAIASFGAGADLGDADSQYALGVLYSNMLERVPENSSGPTSGEGQAEQRHGAGVAYHRSEEASAVLHLYAASVAGHPGALMAMGYRHSQGYGVPKSCNTAALNYMEVARRVAAVYGAGMPQAVELVRLGVDGHDRKMMSASERSLFVELAAKGDSNVAAAVGKRYLLGIEGFRQNYKKAAHHLQSAASRNHAGARALLGYMYCLGLGVAKNEDVAHAHFVAAAKQDEPLGHNGLGYFYFHGSVVGSQDLALALHHFNASAFGGSADGMFNLASLYLTGGGTEQSFQRAMLWYTQALDRGHTSAAYTLAIMHLNGIGTVRNCKMAVELLKRVCERGGWVAQKLQDAYDHKDPRPESAAWLFLRLAEAGHEVAQMNLAHLLDIGTARLLLREASQPEVAAEAQVMARIHAQRHYELSAEQGNVLSDLRLGDYAYYGWGVRVDDGLTVAGEDDAALEKAVSVGADEWLAGIDAEVRFIPQEADVELSMAHYKRTAAMRITGEWMQPFVARASFNLGLMHQFGVGVAPNAPLARKHYDRCLEVDPEGVRVPVAVMLWLLRAQACFAALPPARRIASALLSDVRAHVVAVHLAALLVLLAVRRHVARPRAPAGRRHISPVALAAGDSSANVADGAGASESGRQ